MFVLLEQGSTVWWIKIGMILAIKLLISNPYFNIARYSRLLLLFIADCLIILFRSVPEPPAHVSARGD
jgi:hypothetical protein